MSIGSSTASSAGGGAAFRSSRATRLMLVSGSSRASRPYADMVDPLGRTWSEARMNSVGGKRHDLLPVAAVAGGILLRGGKRDPSLRCERDQGLFGDGHPVGVSATYR